MPKSLVVALLGALCLSACGVDGPPVPPPPRAQPAPAPAPGVSVSGTVEMGVTSGG
ncbi:hypothetical protein [Frigidibacter sp. MR17.24]|uniref:hypothetical protein n=1 Tax=Frigidibacter sp. MR17.24 TaxID=3127345 RepID=UPI003012D22F